MILHFVQDKDSSPSPSAQGQNDKVGGYIINISNIPKEIYLYDEGIKGLRFNQIKKFINDNFGGIKIYLIKLKKEAVKTKGLLFDYVNTKRSFDKFRYANKKDSCHIILTNKLFATFNEDGRPHIRASIYSALSIISTSGIVEGPAKPKQYYLYKQRFTPLGMWDIEEPKIKKKFKGRFIDYGDKRLTEILKGYVAQAVFFCITGEPFCSQKSCRLFNAHWQEDLIYSQIKRRKFCSRHKKILNDNDGR